MKTFFRVLLLIAFLLFSIPQDKFNVPLFFAYLGVYSGDFSFFAMLCASISLICLFILFFSLLKYINGKKIILMSIIFLNTFIFYFIDDIQIGLVNHRVFTYYSIVFLLLLEIINIYYLYKKRNT